MGSLSNPNAYSGIVKNSDSGGSGFPVNITDPQEGQILTFDSENQEWVNSDSRIKVVTVTSVEREATQEDVDNYRNCLNPNNELDDITVGVNYIITEVNCSYEDIVNKDIVILNSGNSYGKKVFKGFNEFEGSFYSLYMIEPDNYNENYYSLYNNLHLRNYREVKNV